MKRFIVCCLMAVLCVGVCAAQKNQPKKSTVRTVVFATDIDCEHCVRKIENNVPSLGKGIRDVQADVATKRVTVTFDESKNSVENIVKGFASLRVKAEPVEEGGDGRKK